jgi:hypothetical protein
VSLTARARPLFPYLGAILIAAGLGTLLLRALWSDREADAAVTANPARFDPRAYHDLVNTEIAPHLEYCPVYEGGRGAGAGVEEAAYVEADLAGIGEDRAGDERAGRRPAPTAPAALAGSRCDCEDRRLGPFFCLRSESQGLSAQAAEKIRRFERRSWLAGDLDARNRWEIRRDRGRIDSRLIPGVRRQRLGGESGLGFTGSVLYRAGRLQGVLVDDAGNAHELGAPTRPARGGALPSGRVEVGDWLRLQEVARREGTTPQRTRLAIWPDLTFRNGTVELRPFDGRNDKLFVIARESLAGAWVAIDGAMVDTKGERRIFALEAGQQLQLRTSPERVLGLRLTAQRTGILSEPVVKSGRLVRTYDSGSGVDDLVRSLVVPLDGAIGDLAEAATACDRDPRGPDSVAALAAANLWLSLEPVLQMTARRKLQEFAETLPGRVHFSRGLWREGARLVAPPRLRLVVLDADAGDLLALATYPDATAVRRMIEVATHEKVRDREEAATLEAHLRDELKRASPHLEPHPIGSLFKPLLAWAAGETDERLIQFTVPAARTAGWSSDPRRNRLLEQCLIRTGPAGSSGDRTHFELSYQPPPPAQLCSPTGPVDLCSALSASDTYWFLELGARLQALRHGRPLPRGDLPPAQRDQAYGLTGICNEQLATGPGAPPIPVCSGPKEDPSVGLLPLKCDRSADPFCRIAERIGALPQAIGGPNAPETTRPFLGPLAGWMEKLTGEVVGESAGGARSSCCPDLQLDPEQVFRWISPGVPQWSRDLLGRCTHEYEVFLGGGGANYWNDIHLVQSFGRLYGPDERLDARLVLKVGDREGTSRGGRPPRPDCLEGDRSPRCLVLEGLRQAVARGTLRRLSELPAQLSARLAGRTPDLRGKTGTTRALYPAFARQRPGPRQPERWVRTRTTRKSLHLVLLVGVPPERGVDLRHFVVYLGIEGVDADEPITASNLAAPFFAREGAGRPVLESLLDFAQRPSP